MSRSDQDSPRSRLNLPQEARTHGSGTSGLRQVWTRQGQSGAKRSEMGRNAGIVGRLC